MKNITILVGAQWGDEGKGKWVDILSDKVDIVARYQGGNNAGHTLYIKGEKFVLHQIPSGIFQPGGIGALTAGVVVSPASLVEEMARVAQKTTISPERLWLSARAHVISPWHVFSDGARESTTSQPIGTTKKGIGPTYSEKVSRTGLRLGEFVSREKRESWLNAMRSANPDFARQEIEQKDVWRKFHDAAEALAPYVCDAEHLLRSAVKAGKKVLLEGAQGSLLDINHGTYPYVTSSETIAGGAISGIGLNPRWIDGIYGVAKGYATRVGEGPFPTELNDAVGKTLAERGQEFGATTGRPRRCGWLDAVALRYSVDINGFDALVLNKMDILTGLAEVKVAEAYKHPTLGVVRDFPWDAAVLAQCEPVYKAFPGWTDDIPKSGKIADLPTNARRYVEAVEEMVGCPITMVGTGVGRGDCLFR